MTTNKEKEDDETIKNKNGSKIPTIDSNKTISNNNNKHIKKATTKVKSALWSSSDSGDANNDNIYGVTVNNTIEELKFSGILPLTFLNFS